MLAKAVQYTLNRRGELTRFLDDGRIELDTGLLERSLRGPTPGRKNYLFFGSLAGGRTAAALYSFVQSAKLYHLDVTAYLTDVLRRLPAIEPKDQSTLRELLPDRWAQTHPTKRAAASPTRVSRRTRTTSPTPIRADGMTSIL